MGKINIEWHDHNIMPKHPTPGERLHWHAEHSKHCGCHPLSEKLKNELRTAGLI
jgi:hypothetical protein